MIESMHEEGAAGAADETESGTDYRIREVEARLERRVAVLEAQRDRMRLLTRLMGAGSVVLVLALGAVLSAMSGSSDALVTRSLSTQEVVLRDADGIVRARLGMDTDGRTQLSLADRDARARIRLTVLPDGSPGVTITDSEARPRVVLGHLPDGTTSLVLADADGVSRAVLGLEPDGATHVLFADRSGAIRTLVGVGANGVPSVSTNRGTQARVASDVDTDN